MNKTIIIIPARMASRRFPGKPLIKIKNKTMLEHVRDRAIESGIGEVLIACCDNKVKNFLEEKKINYVMTKKSLQSGTDRVNSAFNSLKYKREYDFIINLQGDVPFINHKHIIKLKRIIKDEPMKIATLVSELKVKDQINNPNIVKAVISEYKRNYFKALYFSRAAIPFNSEKYYEHVGVYAYTRKSLEKFVKLKKSFLEKQEKLEQLRALENNMEIVIGKIRKAPISIDTPEDLKLL